MITLYLLVVNKCLSEAPENYYQVCVDVIVVDVVDVVAVIVVVVRTPTQPQLNLT